uniref:Uncharacterized protein n=1 Tax=Anguilla anguilla TaxID=7936 RepID=A0A0E9TJM1_ANGAN
MHSLWVYVQRIRLRSISPVQLSLGALPL